MSSYHFNIDKALAAWRRSLKHNRAFTPDDLDELEQHLRDQIAGLVALGLNEEAAFRRAIGEMGDYSTAEAEYRKVYWGKRRRRGELRNEFTWRFSMFTNYLKIAFRTLRKQAGYTLLNVTGLAVGIACCLLIGLYVRHEWSFDHFHEKADRLYRLTYENRIGADLPPATPDEYRAWGSAAIAPLLETDFSEVEHAVRLSGRHQILLSQGEHAFQEEDYFFADSAFFEVFSFPLLEGNPATALAQPNSIILTETAAQRYFGNQEAFGQTLRLENEITLTVTGVMADVPANSHLEFDILLSMSTFENDARANDQAYKFDNWGYIDFFTYVLLRDGTSAEAFQAQLPAFVQRYNGDALQDPPQSYTLALEPITEAYLSPVGSFQPGSKGDEASLYLFVVIAAFILLIACINFMNLSTAHATSRAKEVGVRKTVGARRTGLIGQFLAEAILLATVATGVAVVLAHVTLPLFRMLADKEISSELLTSVPVAGVLLIGTLLVGVLAGSYPALVISAFRPSQVLKGNFATSSRGIALRKGLVVFQFAAAIVLIVGTLVVRQQLHYLQERPLGFDDAQQLVLDFGGDSAVLSNMESIKEELATLPGVQHVAATRSIPGDYYPHATTRVEAPDGAMREVVPGLYEVDTDFLPQIGLEAAAGRLFSSTFATDAEEALLLNEAAAQELGYADVADVVGKRFTQWGREGVVVGVVKDFNFESLRHEISPLTFRVSPWLNYIVLQVATEDAAGVVAEAQDKWSQLVPHRPFLYSFLDQSFDAQYRAEDRFGMLFGTFAALAIFVACLGLFGLAAYAAQQRTKEIGVRKVLGASVPSIIGLLSKDFLQLVGIAFVVAVPVAYLAMQHWLDDFAYRIEVGPGIFVFAVVLVLLVAVLTVSYQSIKAALADPVKSLRYE